MNEPDTMHPHGGAFDFLSPQLALEAVEQVFDVALDGTLTAFPSYVNRVYGMIADDGTQYIAKFYRPDRWSDEAISEEHQFLADCVAADVPVVSPLPDAQGETLHSVISDLSDPDGETVAGSEVSFRFALFPKRSGRLFDSDRDQDYIRLGSLVGRMHAAGVARTPNYRIVCTPTGSTHDFVDEIEHADVVTDDVFDDYFECVDRVLDRIEPLFEGVALQRIHGDCHRGNILDRVDEGLMLIDFDDMMIGPVVHDVWLLMPGRLDEAVHEVELLLEGYEQFRPFDRRTLRLIEPLRFMRIIYYTAWCARQRNDARFLSTFPDWGSAAFWIKELEDLRTQERVILEQLDAGR